MKILQNDQIKTLHKEYITFQFTNMRDSQHFDMGLLPFLLLILHSLQKTKSSITFETSVNEWLEIRKICQWGPQLSWLNALVFIILKPCVTSTPNC